MTESTLNDSSNKELTQFEIHENYIAGFFKRLFALIIDILFLVFISYVLTLVFKNQFIALGQWGRFIGFIIAFFYFSILNSSIANGQTIGKRLLYLKVVNINGDPLSLLRSISRYLILAIPFLLNGAHFIYPLIDSIFIYILSFIIFTGIFGNLYLLIFNRNNRQCIHDIISQSIVINELATIEKLKKTNNLHYFILSLFSLLTLILPTIGIVFKKQLKVEELSSLQKVILEQPTVTQAYLIQSIAKTFSTNGNSKPFTSISSNITINHPDVGNKEFSIQQANKILATYPDAINIDVIQITIRYGYDIGFWSGWRIYSENYQPQIIN